jgi:hypothetical protein
MMFMTSPQRPAGRPHPGRLQIGMVAAFKSEYPAGFIGIRTSMSAVDTDRMMPLDEVEGWLRDAGFLVTERRRVLRNKELDFADEERNLLVEFRGRYSFIPEQERAAGLRLMRAEAKANAASWIDPRPTSLIAASKTGLVFGNQGSAGLIPCAGKRGRTRNSCNSLERTLRPCLRSPWQRADTALDPH